MQAFDLHTHSIYSDGTQTPAAIVRAAKEAGLAFVALTDHDTVMGVPEAMAEGARASACALCPAWSTISTIR